MSVFSNCSLLDCIYRLIRYFGAPPDPSPERRNPVRSPNRIRDRIWIRTR